MYKYISFLGLSLMAATSLFADKTNDLRYDRSLFQWFQPSDNAVERVRAVAEWDNDNLTPEQNDILRTAKEIDLRYQENLKRCDESGRLDNNFDTAKCRDEQAQVQERNIQALEKRVHSLQNNFKTQGARANQW